MKISIPQNLKYTKFHKSCYFSNKKYVPKLKCYLSNFDYMIIAESSGFIKLHQITAFYKTVMKGIKPTVKKRIGGKGKKVVVHLTKTRGRSNKNNLVLSMYPRVPVTRKAIGVRMGKGKGSVDDWCFPISCGSVIARIKNNVLANLAFNGFVAARSKLPIKTKIVFRYHSLFRKNKASNNKFC